MCCNLAAFGRHGRTPALTVCKDQFAQKRNSPRVRFGIERSVSSTLVGERVFARTQIRNLTRLLLLFACAKRSRTALGASWGFLGRSWVLLGPLGGSSGASWIVLGTSWEAPVELLGSSWVLFGISWGPLGSLLGSLGLSWGLLAGSWEPPGSFLGWLVCPIPI